MTSPWKDSFVDLQQLLDEVFDETIYRRWAITNPTGWRPPLDLYITPDAFLVEIDLPGVSPDQVQIELTERRLTVSGERRSIPVDELVSSRLERICGRFQRTLDLPGTVAPERAVAHCRDGTCLIRLPRWSPSESVSLLPKRGSDQLEVAIRVPIV